MYDDDAVVSWLEIRRPWFDCEHTIRQLCIPLRRLRCIVGYAVSTPLIEYLHNSTVRTLSTLCPLARQELQRRILRRLFVPTDRIYREHVHLESTVHAHNPIHGRAQPLLLEPVEPSPTDGIQSTALELIGSALDPEPGHMKAARRGCISRYHETSNGGPPRRSTGWTHGGITVYLF
jgi:hypothetical protein